MATTPDPSRLHILLMNTGLQQKDQPLYQVIHDLISTLSSVNTQVNNVITGTTPIGTPGTPPIITPNSNNQMIEFMMGLDGSDGDDGFIPGPPGLQGLQGIQGFQGIPGLDGNDGSDDGLLTPPITASSQTLNNPNIGNATGNTLSLIGNWALGTGALQELFVSNTVNTSSATNYYGIFCNVAYNPTTNSSGTLYAIFGKNTITPTATATVSNIQIGVIGQVITGGTGSGLISDIRGFSCSVSHTSSNPVGQNTGLYGIYGASGSGNTTAMYGVYLNPSNSGSGTIATHAGILALTPTGGGPITASYGIKINNQGAAGIVHAYGFNVLEAAGASTTNVTFCIGVAPTGVSYSFYNASTVLSLFIGSISHGAAEIDKSYQIYIPITLGTVTMSAGQQRAVINPAGTLAVLTVTLPPSPIDGQIAAISFTQAITALTINAPAGATVIAPLTAAAIDTSIRFIYQASSTSWFPAG